MYHNNLSTLQCLHFCQLFVYNYFYLFQYSLDNEAERQKYEMLQNQRLQGVVTQPNSTTLLSGTQQLNSRKMDPQPSTSRRVGGPRPQNLEQLYHEALPMNKALSHSGPSAFGNGLIVSLSLIFVLFVHCGPN